MKPTNIILDLLRTYPDKGASAKVIMSTGLMFGFNENQMRVSLSRLVTKKTLENFKRGYYRMTEATDPINEFVEQWRLGEKRMRRWTEGEWIGVHTLNTLTSREIWPLESNGFRQVVANLWIRPDNLRKMGAELEQELQLLGLPQSAVILSQASLNPHHENMWMDFFDIQQLNDNYQKMQLRLENSMLQLPKISLQEGKQQSFNLGGEAIQLLIKDPLIPNQVQTSTIREALWHTMIQYDQVGREIWARNSTGREGNEDLPDIIPTRRLIAR